MKNKFTHFTTGDMLRELLRREQQPLVIPPQILPLAPALPITPYEIICKMIENEWHEDPRIGESNPNIDKMWAYLGLAHFTDDQSYCAATVNVCLKLAGYKTSDVVSVARSFEDYGKNTGSSYVKKGDLVIFKRKSSTWKGHVGFVKSVRSHTFLVAGGNQNDKMCFKHYNVDSPVMSLSCVRRITDDDKIGEPDYKTLKKWKLIP